MFALFGDSEMNFDVDSSPISYQEMKQQDTDFTLNFNSASPSKIEEIPNVDPDFFSDFTSFESTLTMSPGLGQIGGYNINLQDSPKAQFLPNQGMIPNTKGMMMPDVFVNRMPIANCNRIIPNINGYQKPSMFPIPTTISKENSNSNIQFNPQLQKPIQKEPINISKKQKLKRKCEVFQPFSSFSNLETTVKSLRNIVKNNVINNNKMPAPTSSRIFAPQPMIASLA